MSGHDRGFTLAELLAAMGVIAVGLVGLLAVVPVAGYGVQEGNQLSTATFLAEQRLEEIRNTTWSAVGGTDCLGVGPTGAPVSNQCSRVAPTACVKNAACTTFPDEAGVATNPAYARTVRVIDCGTTACGGVTHADLRLAIVSVSYAPMTGAGVSPTPKTVSVSMLITRRL